MGGTVSIIHPRFLGYLSGMLTQSMTTDSPTFIFDHVMQLTATIANNANVDDLDRDGDIAFQAYSSRGVIGVYESRFQGKILNQFISMEVERKIIALKKGYPHLPSTKASTIAKGFGYDLESSDVLAIYASHGLVQGMKQMRKVFDFTELNRRVEHLDFLTKQHDGSEEIHNVTSRFAAMCAYLNASGGEKEQAILESGMKRSLFSITGKTLSVTGCWA